MYDDYDIESINQIFKDNGYEILGKNKSFSLSTLWEEENGEEKIRLLVRHNIFTEYEKYPEFRLPKTIRLSAHLK